jgi:chaperonin GroEL
MLERPLKEYLEEVAVKKIDKESLFNLAMVSSNGDTKISDTVATVVGKNGKDGHYIVEERDQDGITSEQIKGYVLDSGYTNQAFVNTKTGVEMLDPVVLVKQYMSLNDIAEVASEAIKAGRPFLCIGQCDEQALASLVANHINGRGQFCNVSLNAVGSKRDDLEADLTALAPYIKKAHITRKMATFEYYDNDEIKTLCKSIENESKTLTGAEKAWCKERLARLESKIAKIYVGAETTAQMVELKDRLEDAILAVIQGFDGYVPGAGKALSDFGKTIKMYPKHKAKVFDVIRNAVGVKDVPDTVIEPANLVYQVYKTAVEQAILIKRTHHAI